MLRENGESGTEILHYLYYMEYKFIHTSTYISEIYIVIGHVCTCVCMCVCQQTTGHNICPRFFTFCPFITFGTGWKQLVFLVRLDRGMNPRGQSSKIKMAYST